MKYEVTFEYNGHSPVAWGKYIAARSIPGDVQSCITLKSVTPITICPHQKKIKDCDKCFFIW